MSSTTAPQSSPPFLDDDATRLLDEFVVSQAAELARNGAYDRAESILRPTIERPGSAVIALDLQARIFVQQGRIAEAETLWRKVLEREPGNAACQAALARIRRMRRKPTFIAILWPAALAVIVVVLVVAWLQFQSHRNGITFSRWEEILKQTAGNKSKPTDVALLAKITTLEQLLTTSSNTIRRLESTIAENSNRNKKSAGEPIVSVSANPPATPTIAEVTTAPQQLQWPTLDLTGIRQVSDGGKLKLIFDDGLFSHGTYFKPGAKARLAAVLKALAQSEQQLVIEVVGYSDGDQGFFGPHDPYSTGLNRAATTVDFIQSSALFSQGQLRASSEGSTHLPFPSDSAKGGAQNRTVVLQISRDENHQ